VSRLMEYAFTSLTFKFTKPSHLCHRFSNILTAV
jgi:hypothetical protein